MLAAAIPLIALTQPFLPSVPGAAFLVVLVAALIVPLWRNANDLEHHVRAGAQLVLEQLAAQSQQPDESAVHVAPIEETLPGMGAARAFRLPDGSRAIGLTLGQLYLRGQTGATVVAIDRGEEGVIYPTEKDIIRQGDTFVLTGSAVAVSAAVDLLSLQPAIS